MNQIAVIEADAVVATMSRARAALAEAKTIQETKRIVDAAAAAEIYAKRQKLGEETSDLAQSIKIEALRKLGEMLRSTPRAKGARTVGGGTGAGGVISVPPAQAPTLEDLGLTKKESAVAQKLAALPEDDFQNVLQGHTTVAKAIAAIDAAKAKPKRQISNPEHSSAIDEPTPTQEPERDGPSDEELAAMEAAEAADREILAKLLDSDDALATAHAEIKRLNALAAGLEQRVNGLLNEKAEAIRLLKKEKNRADRLQKMLDAKVAA